MVLNPEDFGCKQLKGQIDHPPSLGLSLTAPRSRFIFDAGQKILNKDITSDRRRAIECRHSGNRMSQKIRHDARAEILIAN
jgi:hypothetical protein